MKIKKTKIAKKEIELFRKNKNQKNNGDILKKFDMEYQQMEASKNLREYSNIPRKPIHAFHKLKGKCNKMYSVGISSKHRIVLEPLDNSNKNLCEHILLHHSIFDYHKE